MSDMLTLGTDGMLFTTGLVDFSKPIAWSFDARMSGFDLGYKDYSVQLRLLSMIKIDWRFNPSEQ